MFIYQVRSDYAISVSDNLMLKQNVIANFLGQGWAAVMGLAFVPLYIHYLGIEAYGLIGLFAVLTAWLSLLDMGMTPVLGREMSRFKGGAHSIQSIHDLLRSIEVVALVIAIFIAGIIATGSAWLASDWLKAEDLSVELVAEAFSIMGLVTALRFMEGVYRSSILGLQRQVLFNIVNSSIATLRGLGAVGVLAWVSSTIQAFFLWQAIVSIATIVILAITTYSSLPKPDRPARFSLAAIRSVWRFAGGMVTITFLALLLTQIDKILLSKLLTLTEYGYYTVAAVVAGAISLMVAPVAQAWFPRLSQLHAADNMPCLVNSYHQGAQLVTIIAGSVAMVLFVFADTFLLLWTQDTELVRRTATLLSLLALGNLLNGLMWIPYQTQLAYGWTSLSVRINVVAVLLIVPAIFWVVPIYGAEGAAWVWVGLNIGYLVFGIHFMYRRILTREKWVWYFQDIFMPLSGAVIAVFIVKSLLPDYDSPLSQFLTLMLAGCLALLFSMALASTARSYIKSVIFNS